MNYCNKLNPAIVLAFLSLTYKRDNCVRLLSPFSWRQLLVSPIRLIPFLRSLGASKAVLRNIRTPVILHRDTTLV